MQNQPNIKVSKGFLALMLAGTLLGAGFLIVAPKLVYADIPRTIPAHDASGKPLTGSSSLFYTAHRIPDPRWAGCFAVSCSAGSGPGASMWFDIYDKSGTIIADGLSDETGVTITGLAAGSTYYIRPSDCDLCHNSTHNVVFYYWYNGDKTNPRGFLAGECSPVTGAYYRYYDPSQSNPTPGPAPGQNGGSGSGSCGGSGSGGGGPPPVQHRNPMRVDASDLSAVIDLKKVVISSIELNQTGIASISNITTISDATVPDISLSGVPIGPTGHISVYKTFYDVVSADPDGVMKAEATANSVGIDWNKLTDMQKAYFTLTVLYNTPASASVIPDTDLSGVPLGANHVKIHYKSLSDIANGDAMGLEKAELAADALGLSWNGLTDNQKEYMALVLEYGQPSPELGQPSQD